MSHYLIELLVWTIIAYLLGCLVGWILKNLFAAAPVQEVPAPAPAMARPITPAPSAPRPAPIPVAARPSVQTAATVSSASTESMARPKGLTGARGGKADDLQRISGIGPKNESILHNLGIFHFDQIAAWTTNEIAWVDDHLRFGGRILREEWIRQAKLLAEGKEKQFTEEFGTGGLKGKDGQPQSGSHTRNR
jgi:predicted flap endonuclease-1-like 5' DNA nuclease